MCVINLHIYTALRQNGCDARHGFKYLISTELIVQSLSFLLLH